jgi:hypothetical protein
VDVRREPANLVSVRRNSKHEALQQALRVPWQRLYEAAATFAEWHMIILWVRVITEAAEQVPQIVRSELRSRCPGFLESWSRQEPEDLPAWKSLQEWVAETCFAEAKTEGWFDAVMYYAYADLRVEQAWTTWKRLKADWRHARPGAWPTLEQWTAEVLATRSLADPGTEKARAVRALGVVEPSRFSKALVDSLEFRALALWADAVSEAGHNVDEAVLAEFRCRSSAPLPADALWGRRFFSRLIRAGDSIWRTPARAEGWYPALRFAVLHHPRYQRFIHYNQRCHDLWLHGRPKSRPPFSDWLAAADAYHVAGGAH